MIRKSGHWFFEKIMRKQKDLWWQAAGRFDLWISIGSLGGNHVD
jgi:hypothetical protein